MAKGDFDKQIKPKVTNHACECCGFNTWNVLDEINGEVPALLLAPKGDQFNIPPQTVNCTITMCDNCRHLRFFALMGDQMVPTN